MQSTSGCGCNFRQFRQTRQVQRSTGSSLPCGVNAATIAKPASRGNIGAKVDNFAWPQKNDRFPNETGLRSPIELSYNPRVRKASTFWARNKKNPSFTRTPLNSIAVNRTFLPCPPPPAGSPRTLPPAYYDAPAVILPARGQCGNFNGNCVVSRETQMQMIAEEVAKARERGDEFCCAPSLNFSVGNCPNS